MHAVFNSQTKTSIPTQKPDLDGRIRDEIELKPHPKTLPHFLYGFGLDCQREGRR
jgi:hypothetical protein